MTVSRRIVLAVLTLSLPLVTAAQEIPNVSGIRAEQVNGNVTVRWDPVDVPVKKFRVFYSHASILDQGGEYDDYEDAPGNATELTLSSVPPVPMLYVSVLAVGENNEESPFFLEEASIELRPGSGMQNDSSSSIAPLPPSPTVAMQSDSLQLLTAVSTSETGVTLVFTHALSIPEEYKAQAFRIRSGSGQELPVVRYTLHNNQVLLDTGTQVAGRVYQVVIHGSVAGKTTGGELVPQENATAPLLFTGLQTNTSTPDVTNLALSANGKDVVATWTPVVGTIRELQVQQSTNGGRTFGTAVRMDKASKGVTIPNVGNGTFTLLIRSLGIDGSLSRGAQQTITVGGKQTSSASSASSVSTSKSSASSKPAVTGQKPTQLPSSGLGLSAIVGLSGAATGMRFLRRKNARKA